MFRSSGPFKQIGCPFGGECRLLNCIFSHTTDSEPRVTPAGPGTSQKRNGNDKYRYGSGVVVLDASKIPQENDEVDSPPRKRQRRSASPSKPEVSSTEVKILCTSSEGSVKPNSTLKKGGDRDSAKGGAVSSTQADRSPVKALELQTQKKAVSPPPFKEKNLNSLKTQESSTSTLTIPLKRERREIKKEALVPRTVPKPPAKYGHRDKLLTLLHEQFNRLNEEVLKSSDPWKDALALSPAEVVMEALDEEERIARGNSTVYANVLKLRLAALKKMKFETWRAERIKQIEKDQPEVKKPVPPPARISTGLTEEEEIALLASMVTSQEGLAQHGYVTTEISEAQIDEARHGVEAAKGYEVCDRCGSRFQVFPGRREEDGALTSGGECTYHPGRVRRPPKEAGRGAQPERYLCCLTTPGSPGCTKAAHHVFKVSEAKRLALVLPFARVPATKKSPAGTAVCFDCEMGYTTMGMELIRLTATAWPSERELLDVLVRPIGEILDLNSTFSGVRPQHFTDAVPYGKDAEISSDTANLRVVDSPSAARSLLFDHLTPTTPLMGHALENDLNAARIIHPTVVDTVLLYPHARGLPLRHGLKHLVKTHLGKDIQTAGAQGHDSKEDARAAGELVLFRVAEKWKRMQLEGWTLADGAFNPPRPKDI